MFYRFLTRHNFIVYTYRRLVVGMLLASLSLLAAGATETARLQDIYQNGVSFEPLGECNLIIYCMHVKFCFYIILNFF